MGGRGPASRDRRRCRRGAAGAGGFVQPQLQASSSSFARKPETNPVSRRCYCSPAAPVYRIQAASPLWPPHPRQQPFSSFASPYSKLGAAAKPGQRRRSPRTCSGLLTISESLHQILELPLDRSSYTPSLPICRSYLLASLLYRQRERLAPSIAPLEPWS